MENSFTNDILEKMFLHKVLTSIEYANIFSEVYDSRWFDNKNIAILCKLALNFYKKYDKLANVKTLGILIEKYAEKNANPNFNLASANELLYENITDLVGDITEDIYKNEIKAFVKNKGLLYAISDNIEEIEKFGSIDRCLARFEKIQNLEFDTDLGMDYFTDVDKHFNEYILNPEARISTGWEGVDQVTEGGFLKNGRSLYIVMAQAGLGKSVQLSNLALNFLKQNMTVVIISLEMSTDVYAQRFDAHISENNINHLNETSTDSLNRIHNFYKKYPKAKLFIKEWPPNTITVSVIDTYIEKLKKTGVNPDVIIVDYLNIIKSRVSDKSGSYFEGKDISEDLRALSYKYSAPVITAVQSNTEGMDNEDISMKNVAESRAIVHTADFLWALYQVGDEDRENGIIRARILKNRLGGRVGKQLLFKFNPESLVLNDVTITSQKVTLVSDEDIDEATSDKSNMVDSILKDLD